MKAFRCIAVSLGLALVVALIGCESVPAPPAGSSFFVARLQDCKPDTSIPACNHFAAGEVPAAVCINHGGRTVTIRVDITTGATSWSLTELIPTGRTTVWWGLKNLPAGTYKAEIRMGGTFLQSYHFEILKPAPGRR